MIINEISIKGFKSYGNNEQILKLNTENGELILLVGSNGSGKSSLISSFDYTLYGRVRGMRKKWSTLSTLPNRINNELLNKIKFESNGTDVEIHRGISPGILRLFENGVENDKAGKSNIDDKIENYIGIDIETFKSFISISVNDFKNFISLSNEEKQLLLDKLFNLDAINILNSILKDINKTNKLSMIRFDSEIQTLNESINSIQRSIEKAIEKEKLNIQEEISTIKSEMDSKKGDYILLKEKSEKIREKEKELIMEIDVEKDQLSLIQNNIRNTQSEINLYEAGKCPTCKTEFVGDYFVGLKSTLDEKLTSLTSIKLEIEGNILAIREKQSKLKGISDNTNTNFNNLTYLLKGYKSQIDKLENQSVKESGKSNQNVEEFENAISELSDKKTKSYDNSSLCKDKEIYYKELSKVFGEDGVKKSIISKIIRPINFFISDNLRKMGLPFQVILDETFTAEIKHLGNTSEHDSLSTGENKLINIAILVSYLRLIRTRRNINVLFLDEVFSSIDVDNIDKILYLLKDFADEYKINIFVVHHALLKQEMFDRILKIEKGIFSTIEEIQI